ncbi:TlpA family protein disulfide reductase [Rubrivirga sp. IMCC43871]|uniref:TlpA family protein disulfide reductase n=1 Tax=Rubrivirga sp. IMCC43871 TaxID=3391575 RepID=UPI0039902CE0
MRIGLAAVLATGIVPAVAQAQAADTTFLNRNIRQQMFLVPYIQDRKSGAPPATEAEVDAYISGAAEAWAAEAEGEDPHVQRLNPYVAVWLLNAAYSAGDVPDELECHNYTEHVVPAFLADFEQYREVDPAHAPLIFWGHDWAGGSLAFRCDVGTERWGALQAAFERAPSLYREYADAGAFPDEDVADKVRRARLFYEGRARLYGIRGGIYRGNLDTAFAGLAAAATQGFAAYDLRPLGEALWRAYADKGQIDYALATLDLLARTLTAADLPRDTLRAWYEEADPERGPQRFGLMTASAPLELVGSGEQADLTGTYIDLLTGEPVELAVLAGRLVLFDFWATWCGPCIAEIPELQALVAEHGDRVTFVSVNADAVTEAEGPDGVRAFMGEHGVDYPVLYDDPDRSLAVRFGVGGYPAKFLVSPEGDLLVHPTNGHRTVSLGEVEAYLESLR